jgi:AcrR family transcriptional regulator
LGNVPSIGIDADTEDRWRGTPLPRGRHSLSRTDVQSSQRQRLLRAMLECVGTQGYAATTVPQVVAAARVAKNSFYEFFDDKLGCFLELCDQEAADLFRVASTGLPAPSWRVRAAERTEAYLRWWQERPAFSRAYLVEAPFAGPQAIEQRERQSEPYRRMYRAVARRARVEEPELPPMPAQAPDVLVAGILDVVAREVRAGRTHELVTLAPALTSATIAILSGEPRPAPE